MLRPPRSTLTDPLFPYTALFRSIDRHAAPIHSPGITRIHDARRRARRRQRACITGAVEGNPAPKLVEGSDAPHIGLATRRAGEGWHPRGKRQIGRASCRERGGQYVEVGVVSGAIKKNNTER